MRADLLLEASDALSTVDDFGTALDAVITNFQTTATDAIASLAAPIAELAATPLVENVTADVGEAATAIGTLDDSPIDIPVEADTTAAEQSIGSLGDSIDTAAGSGQGLQGSLEGVSAAGAALRGNAEGAAVGLGGLTGASTAALGAATALGGGLAFLAQNATDDASAQFRFNQVLGDFKGLVETIKVGNLNIGLTELAIKVGSTDDALQNATAQAFQFAQVSGFTGEQAATFASRLAAISARAVALNPNLGDVGDAASRLTTALASGRERALLPFNLGLSQAEIKAHAAALGLAEVDGTVGRAQLAFAGADLAAKKFGNTLQQDIAEGSKNPIIQQRSLKAALEETLAAIARPLIFPALGVLQSATPLVAELGRIFTTLGQSVLPSVAIALKGLSPILDAVAAALEAIQPVLTPLIAGFLAFRAISVIPAILQAVASAFIFTGLASTAAAESIVAANATIEASAGPIGIAIAVIGGLIAAFGGLGGEAKDADLDIQALSRTTSAHIAMMVQELSTARALRAEFLGENKERAVQAGAIRDVTKAAEQNIGTAQRLGQAYVEAGALTEKRFNRIIDQANAGLRQSATDSAVNTAATEKVGTAYQVAAGHASAFQAVLDEIAGGQPSLFKAQTDYAKSVEDLGAKWAAAAGSIETGTQAGRDNRDALNDIVDKAGAAAKAIQGVGGTASDSAQPLIDAAHHIEDLAFASGKTPAQVAAMLGQLGLIPSSLAPGITSIDGLNSAINDIVIRAGLVAAQTPNLGFQIANGLGLGISRGTVIVADYAQGMMEAALGMIVQVGEIGSPSKVTMRYGRDIAAGLALGIGAGTGGVESAAATLTSSALVAPTGAGVAGTGTANSVGGDVNLGPIQITVHGVTDASQGQAVGAAVGDGFTRSLDGATRRRIAQRIRTG